MFWLINKRLINRGACAPHFVKVSPNDVYVTGQGLEIVVKVFRAEVSRAENVLDFPGDLAGLEGEEKVGVTRPKKELTSSFLNCGGREFALWGIWQSPITRTSWEREREGRER